MLACLCLTYLFVNLDVRVAVVRAICVFSFSVFISFVLVSFVSFLVSSYLFETVIVDFIFIPSQWPVGFSKADPALSGAFDYLPL